MNGASSTSEQALLDGAPPARSTTIRQLTLPGVVGVWAAAAIPMAALSWVIAPLLAGGRNSPSALAQSLILLLTAGLVWQFVLVAFLVFKEQRSLRWAVVREALWLRAPRNPKTGRRGGRMWLIVPVFVIAFFAVELIPFEVPPVAGRDFGEFLYSSDGAALLHGSWPWLAILFAFFLFNTVLGEELLFRGYLLPRMNGVFGSKDWVANGILFAVYHLHVPWVIPVALLDTFILSLPSRRYQSALIGIITHSSQSLFLFALVLTLFFTAPR